jgi:succinate dehydrogenase / fumarate reductase membrane anchor subunit
MVTAVTSFGRSGLYDWLVQRVSGVILAAYTFFLAGFILMTPDLQYTQWNNLFDSFFVRIFSLAALVSLAAHAWIGLWAVLTDYLTPRLMGPGANIFRMVLQFGLAIVNVGYLVWGVEIIWGI